MWLEGYGDLLPLSGVDHELGFWPYFNEILVLELFEHFGLEQQSDHLLRVVHQRDYLIANLTDSKDTEVDLLVLSL